MSHGHVTPNENGSRARCGGPKVCKECALELAEYEAKLRDLVNTNKEYLHNSVKSEIVGDSSELKCDWWRYDKAKDVPREELEFLWAAMKCGMIKPKTSAMDELKEWVSKKNHDATNLYLSNNDPLIAQYFKGYVMSTSEFFKKITELEQKHADRESKSNI